MANFFTDNEDIQFYLNDSRLRRITELRERGYTENKAYPFAPEDFEDAQDNFYRVLSLVGEIAADTLAPAAHDVDREGCRLENNEVTYAQGTQEALKRFAQADLFGFTLPRKYGGLNLPVTVYMMAIEIVSRADASFMNLFGLQEIAETICEFGSPELREKYLPKLASGEYTGAMVLTEPEAGSDLQAISLKATYNEMEGCWFLNGVKHFITNGCGDVLLVLARSEENVPGGRGLSLFLCEKNKSLLVRRLEDKLGIHGSPTCELQFRNCRAHLIGQRKRGLTRYVMPLMNGARLAVSAQSIGIAQEAYNQALQYAKQRKQFGKAIIEFPPIAEMLTTMRVQIEAARSLLYEASILLDMQHALDHYGTKNKKTVNELNELNRLVNLLTPMIKYYASEMCNRITYDAIQIFGGSGYMRDYDIERLYRDARITTIYEGTSQLQILGASGGITSGLFFKMLQNKRKDNYPESFNPLIKKIRECEGFLEQAVICVKGQNNHLCTEYHARRLVDMAVETLMALLLLEDARRSEHKFNVAKRFVADIYPRVQMLSEKVDSQDMKSIDECRRILDES
ncbi:MAG: acyl-CoA dehydrogenase family protein [Deltaproteobacteria bacterium]|nr:acyl-CoA dehydrogenase family protein [Deltaproteobacteria bacterium]MBW2073775.1 acyl-CoA dehydrogenase family protein [Deltaproteobacteria bacterium]